MTKSIPRQTEDACMATISLRTLYGLPHTSPSAWVTGVRILAGLLAHGHRQRHLPYPKQWHTAVSSHIQWRDRAGIEPASLLSHLDTKSFICI